MGDNPVIRIHHADVTTLQASLCVSTIHSSKKLKSGQLSSCVLKKAGPCVQEEIYQKNNDVEVRSHRTSTEPGLLSNFRRLMFYYLPQWQSVDAYQNRNQDDIQEAVLDALKYAHRHNFDSVAFPALGMGGLGYPPYEVSMGMLTGIGRFYWEYPSTKIETVHIALYGPNDDSMLMFIQSALIFINKFHRNMVDTGVNTKTFTVIKGDTLSSLEQKPFVKKKSTWERIKALFSRSTPLPSGELLKVDITPKRQSTRSLNAFRHAYNEVKLMYLTHC